MARRKRRRPHANSSKTAQTLSGRCAGPCAAAARARGRPVRHVGRLRGEGGAAEAEKRDVCHDAAAEAQGLGNNLAAERGGRADVEEYCRTLISHIHIDPRASWWCAGMHGKERGALPRPGPRLHLSE